MSTPPRTQFIQLGTRPAAALAALAWFAFGQPAQATRLDFATLCSLCYGGPTGPDTGLVFGQNGAIYGASGGGISEQGVIFELAPPAAPGGAWTETVIYQFNYYAGGGDGREPNGGLVFGANGALYGTTVYGGIADNGTVFELAPPTVPGGAWTETILYRFTGESDGGWPYAGLAIGRDGVLYGTLYAGPAFQLKPPRTAGGAWVYALLYDVGGDANSLLAGPKGVLYGTTSYAGVGTVFDLAPPQLKGDAWTYGLIYFFSPSAGAQLGPLLIVRAGVIFGSEGLDTAESGVVFELTSNGQGQAGQWAESVLHTFPADPTDGVGPGELVMGPKGLLYGTTVEGGGTHNSACGEVGCGTLFQLKPPATVGGAWTEVVLHRFTGASDGSRPGNLILGPDGALYGTTGGGGTLFRLII
jgi:uncharacterized repeat protein (TIGR03803 family)